MSTLKCNVIVKIECENFMDLESLLADWGGNVRDALMYVADCEGNLNSLLGYGDITEIIAVEAVEQED